MPSLSYDPPALPDPNHPERGPQNRYRNRIVGHGEVDPLQLVANPNNWRCHPHAQELAVASLLSSVGWVGSIMVNRRTGFVVDGHMRVANAISEGEATVPVDWVDLDDAAENLILVAYDQLGTLAYPDVEKRDALYDKLNTDTANTLRLLFGEAEERAAQGRGGTPADQVAPADIVSWALTFPATASNNVRDALTELTDTIAGLSWNENG